MRQRRLPVGADFLVDRAHFRVWAPRRRRVSVVLEPHPLTGAGQHDTHLLSPEPDGYFSGTLGGIVVGTAYRFRLDDDEKLYADPASRFQPAGPDGPSEIIDPSVFRWTDSAWSGTTLEGQVIYEMHVGSFTQEGTWAAAVRELPELARAGITLLEVMPIAEFPGEFGWGYDGVLLFAPTRLYGRPDDFRAFVDAAHAHGIGVILDVVYNHFGPRDNYLDQFAKEYYTDRYENEWGSAINFDGPGSAAVRELVTANAGYWIDEYHLDGLRLDATQSIHDRSTEHVIARLAREARRGAGRRSIVLVAENEPQDTRLVRPPEEGGYGLDGLWNDDFHHTAVVALTGRREAYYTNYSGTPQEFISCARRGYLFQGQQYSWQRQPRGTPSLDVPPASFVTFIENHDQVANSIGGRRMHQQTSAGRHRALTTLMLLGPGTPMLFQGQEFSASTPFLFFADHPGDVGAAVRNGRVEFLSQFPSLSTADARAAFTDPTARSTFERCKLNFAERHEHHAAYQFHRDLIALRRQDPVVNGTGRSGVDGAVLGDRLFLLRYFGAGGQDRLLVVNLALDAAIESLPEPLLAPPAGRIWALVFSSEHPAYGGGGTPEKSGPTWRVPGESATFWEARAEQPLRP